MLTKSPLVRAGWAGQRKTPPVRGSCQASCHRQSEVARGLAGLAEANSSSIAISIASSICEAMCSALLEPRGRVYKACSSWSRTSLAVRWSGDLRIAASHNAPRVKRWGLASFHIPTKKPAGAGWERLMIIGSLLRKGVPHWISNRIKLFGCCAVQAPSRTDRLPYDLGA